MANSIFSQVKIDFYNPENNHWYVDAYKTDDPMEEGRVLAEIDLDKKKVYWRDDTIAKERVDMLVMETIWDFMS